MIKFIFNFNFNSISIFNFNFKVLPRHHGVCGPPVLRVRERPTSLYPENRARYEICGTRCHHCPRFHIQQSALYRNAATHRQQLHKTWGCWRGQGLPQNSSLTSYSPYTLCSLQQWPASWSGCPHTSRLVIRFRIPRIRYSVFCIHYLHFTKINKCRNIRFRKFVNYNS